MTALEFKKHQGFGQCTTPGCVRAGRWSIDICGYPVLSESPYATKEARDLFCGPCRTELREAWESAASGKEQGAVEQALGALSGTPSERAEAIWSLRDWGFPHRMIATQLVRIGGRGAVAA